MEETPSFEQPPKVCANCGDPNIDEKYPTPLCSDCRQKFIRFPLPLWIKVFAGAIAVILLFSLFKLPKNISLAVQLERGKKAEKQKKYFTAQRDFEEVVKKVPDNIEAEGHLMIASFYNQDFAAIGTAFKKLEGKNIEDKELYETLDELANKAASYVSNDSFQNFQKQYVDQSITIPDTAYQSYIHRNPDDIFAITEYASRLFDEKSYTVCDSLLQQALKKDNEYFPALMIMASLKREQGKNDESLIYCDRILSVNRESVYGMASKARTYLKQKKDKEALDLAQKSYTLNSKNGYALATLILAYHFNNKTTERDELISKAHSNTDSSQLYQLKYAIDVIDKKEKFRD